MGVPRLDIGPDPTGGINEKARRRLYSIQEFNGAGSAALPATSFDYIYSANREGDWGHKIEGFSYPKLQGIENGYGARTEFIYKMADSPGTGGLLNQHYDYQVHKQSTTDGIHALQATTWYTYGAAYEKDYVIAGYDDVMVVSQDYNGAPLRQTEHHLHNPHNNNASSEELRGREYLSKAFSADGVLLQQVDTHWITMTNGTTTVAHADQVTTTTYTPGEPDAVSRVDYTYDA